MRPEIKAKLIKFLENGQVNEALSFLKLIKADSPARTPSQNSALHLWLNMIEHEAENQGVTWDKLIKHTSQLRVTSEALKAAVKQLIKALWGYTSTTQIKKIGQLDVVIDHVTDWLSKEMEVPAFPCDEEKHRLDGQRIGSINNLVKTDYPEYIGEAKI